jgi:hypothetical protein
MQNFVTNKHYFYATCYEPSSAVWSKILIKKKTLLITSATLNDTTSQNDHTLNTKI